MFKNVVSQVVSFSKMTAEKSTELIKGSKAFVLPALMLGGLMVASSAFAETTAVTIPDVGCDPKDYLSSGITMIGGIVAVAVGGFVAFWGVRAALKWFGIIK